MLVAAGTFATQLAFPGGAVACSCMPREPDAPIFTGEEGAVFIGTARQPRADGTHEFEVERWFIGGSAALVLVQSDREVLADGSTVINTCGLHFNAGDRLIMAAAVRGTVLVPGSCSPHAAVESEQGAQLLNAAVTTFGQGSSPGPPVDTPPPDDPDLAGLALGIVMIVVLVVVLALVGAARQRREEEPAA